MKKQTILLIVFMSFLFVGKGQSQYKVDSILKDKHYTIYVRAKSGNDVKYFAIHRRGIGRSKITVGSWLTLHSQPMGRNKKLVTLNY